MAANFLQQLPKLPNFGKFPGVPGKFPGLYRPKKSIPEHQAMVQRQASMSLIAPHGLQNLTGENNCFLNSAIQVSVDSKKSQYLCINNLYCVHIACPSGPLVIPCVYIVKKLVAVFRNR
jgi:ubiquitin C-terminal hydrolase